MLSGSAAQCAQCVFLFRCDGIRNKAKTGTAAAGPVSGRRAGVCIAEDSVSGTTGDRERPGGNAGTDAGNGEEGVGEVWDKLEIL